MYGSNLCPILNETIETESVERVYENRLVFLLNSLKSYNSKPVSMNYLKKGKLCRAITLEHILLKLTKKHNKHNSEHRTVTYVRFDTSVVDPTIYMYTCMK